MRLNNPEQDTYDADQGGSDFINSLPTPEIKTTEDLIAAATPAAPAPKPTDAMLRGKEMSQTQFDGMTPVYQSSGGSMREGQPGELLGYRFENSQIQEPGMTASYSAPVYESRGGRGGNQVLVDPGGKLLGYDYTGPVEVPKPDAILAYEKQFGTTMEPIYGTRAVEGRGGDRQVESGPPIGYRFDNGKSQYVNFDASGEYQNTQNREKPGALGNIALTVLSIAYPPIAPFIQAYKAIEAIDKGDTLGFILNAAGAGKSIPGLDASTTKLLSDVSTGAKIIKAVETGDPLKILSATATLPNVDPDLKDLSIVVNTAKAINDGNISGAFNGIVKMSDRDSIGRLTDRFDDIVSSSGGGDAATIDNTEGGSGGPTLEEQAAQEQEDREQTSREQIRASEKTIEDTLTDSGLVSTDSSVDTLAQEQVDREQAARDAIRASEKNIDDTLADSGLVSTDTNGVQALTSVDVSGTKITDDGLDIVGDKNLSDNIADFVGKQINQDFAEQRGFPDYATYLQYEGDKAAYEASKVAATDASLAPVTVTTKALQDNDLDITGNKTVGTHLPTTDVTTEAYNAAKTAADRALAMAVKREPVDLRYDVNKDGKVTSADALSLMKGTPIRSDIGASGASLAPVTVTTKALQEDDLPITTDTGGNRVTDSNLLVNPNVGTTTPTLERQEVSGKREIDTDLPITSDTGRNRVTDSSLPVNPNVGTTTPTLETKTITGKRIVEDDLPVTSDTGSNRVTDSSLPVNPNVGTTDGDENKLKTVDVTGTRITDDIGGNTITDSSVPVNPNVGTTDGDENKLTPVTVTGKRDQELDPVTITEKRIVDEEPTPDGGALKPVTIIGKKETPVIPKPPVIPKVPTTTTKPTPAKPSPKKPATPEEQFYQTVTQSQPTTLADIKYYLDMASGGMVPPENSSDPLESLLNQPMSVEELLYYLRS